MGSSKPSAFFSLIGMMLIWLYVLIQTADSTSLPAGQGEERPHVAKRSIESCDSAYDSYCLNQGQCMLLVEMNEHVCKCERGFYGTRCGLPEPVVKPVGEEQVIVIAFSVGLLMIGLAGSLYFCCKCYKRSKLPHQQKQQGYKGVQKV